MQNLRIGHPLPLHDFPLPFPLLRTPIQPISPFPGQVLQHALPTHALQNKNPLQRDTALSRRLFRYINAIFTTHHQTTLPLSYLPGELPSGESTTRGGEYTAGTDDAVEYVTQGDLTRGNADYDIFAWLVGADAIDMAEDP
jgi:hypothetical protein